MHGVIGEQLKSMQELVRQNTAMFLLNFTPNLNIFIANTGKYITKELKVDDLAEIRIIRRVFSRTVTLIYGFSLHATTDADIDTDHISRSYEWAVLCT